METFFKLNNQTVGRDKLARLVQYTSRLVWHQLQSRNVNKYSVDRIKNLELTLSTFRKILRFGRCIDMCDSALSTMNKDDIILRCTLTVSKLAQALFLYADHIVWLTRSGFLKKDTDQWNRTANRFWLLSIIANLVRDLYEIHHILEMNRMTTFRPTEFLECNRKCSLSIVLKDTYILFNCHKDIFIDTLKNSCDLFIPLTALGLTKLSPSTVGVLGAISSLAGIITILNPSTKLVPS